MTKIFVIALAVLFSGLAHAELSPQCQGLIYDAYRNELRLKQAPKDMSASERRQFRRMAGGLIEMSITTCIGLKNVELQRSLPGQLGLIPMEYAAAVDRQTAAEARAYVKYLRTGK